MTNYEPPTLADKMDALAATGHAEADELQAKAASLRDAAEGFYSSPQRITAPQLLGAWARARKLWCKCTGEPLV